MPRGDGSGPNGMGSMTGRAMGYCAGYNAPGFVNGGGAGRGMGSGRGRGGRGYRNQFYATGAPAWARNSVRQPAPVTNTFSREDELRMLKDQSEYLKQTLEDVNRRLQEFEKEE